MFFELFCLLNCLISEFNSLFLENIISYKSFIFLPLSLISLVDLLSFSLYFFKRGELKSFLLTYILIIFFISNLLFTSSLYLAIYVPIVLIWVSISSWLLFSACIFIFSLIILLSYNILSKL